MLVMCNDGLFMPPPVSTVIMTVEKVEYVFVGVSFSFSNTHFLLYRQPLTDVNKGPK